MNFKAGQVVECVERPGWMRGELTRGKRYVVVDIEHANFADYIKIVGDDDRTHSCLETMFRPA